MTGFAERRVDGQLVGIPTFRPEVITRFAWGGGDEAATNLGPERLFIPRRPGALRRFAPLTARAPRKA